ncbi:MAG: hypothetical protein RLZZ70_519 [Candidatus Parcubacteria bacterium]|jgi:hypothetical protein
MRTIVLFIIATLALSVSPAVAFDVRTGQGTINAVVIDGIGYPIPLNRICAMQSMKAGHARYDVGRDGPYITIGGQVTRIRCAAPTGGGSNSVQQGTHTGDTAEEVAEDLDLPPDAVETIDPGPVVNSSGVIDTNNNGSSADEADDVTAEGATQDDAQPDQGTVGNKTNGGNDGVSIF